MGLRSPYTSSLPPGPYTLPHAPALLLHDPCPSSSDTNGKWALYLLPHFQSTRPPLPTHNYSLNLLHCPPQCILHPPLLFHSHPAPPPLPPPPYQHPLTLPHTPLHLLPFHPPYPTPPPLPHTPLHLLHFHPTLQPPPLHTTPAPPPLPLPPFYTPLLFQQHIAALLDFTPLYPYTPPAFHTTPLHLPPLPPPLDPPISLQPPLFPHIPDLSSPTCPSCFHTHALPPLHFHPLLFPHTALQPLYFPTPSSSHTPSALLHFHLPPASKHSHRHAPLHSNFLLFSQAHPCTSFRLSIPPITVLTPARLFSSTHLPWHLTLTRPAPIFPTYPTPLPHKAAPATVLTRFHPLHIRYTAHSCFRTITSWHSSSRPCPRFHTHPGTLPLTSTPLLFPHTLALVSYSHSTTPSSFHHTPCSLLHFHPSLHTHPCTSSVFTFPILFLCPLSPHTRLSTCSSDFATPPPSSSLHTLATFLTSPLLRSPQP
ncbi:hypothetical protein C7M84_012573 [Penaeus vannamei]|uniref:Uncharacterized protein n=1 Tax=Penaeus vannamei TaxID=6689 RepID=A0A423SYG0_PENVA|nr:hypothetical protein C7M84_012573 [Penaeus vannamei]